jgi:hypothetical protein
MSTRLGLMIEFEKFIDVLVEINRFSGVPAILLFLLARDKPIVSKLAFWLVMASFLADFSNYFFIRYIYKNSFIISNTWFIVNYFLLIYLFLKLIPERKTLLTATLGAFLAGTAITFIFYYTFLESNTFIRVFTSISITLICLIIYLEILENSPANNLFQYPVFWIVTALFIYSSATLLKNIFDQYLIFEKSISTEAYRLIFPINLGFNILKNLMLAYAIWLAGKGGITYIKPKTSVS